MKYILFLLLILNSSTVKAQDGKIVSQEEIDLPPDSIVSSSFKVKYPDMYDTLVRFMASVDVYKITYMSDGLKVKGYMDVPKKQGKYPCIIFNRGGNRENSKFTDKSANGGFLAQLASYGYCVVASQYRGNDGGEGAEEFGGKDLNDVLNLIPLLNNIDKADTSRIGMWGTSRGGMMTYLALTKTTRLKAAVVLSGIADFKYAIEHTNFNSDSMFNAWLPEYREQKESFIKARSPIEFADKICKTTPIYIIQGTGDGVVETPPVLRLAEKFYELKQPFRFTLLEGGRHGIGGIYWEEILLRIKDFFDEYVRDGKKYPDLDLR
jgi:dipeptidyl aminopeptidase/acylaminoacyl peptidase